MKAPRQSSKKIIVSTAALLAAATFSSAQDATPTGLVLTLDVTSGASVNDNAGLNDPSLGNTSVVDTGLTFGLSSETRVSQLNLRVGTTLEYRKSPSADGEFNIESPVFSGTYRRQGADSELVVEGAYTRDRLDDSVLTFLDEDFNPVDLTLDSGVLNRLRGSVSFAAGLNGPLGYQVSVSADTRDYIDTLDPDLYDRVSYGVDAAAQLRFSDVMTGTLSVGWQRFEAEDLAESEQTSTSLGVGLGYAVSPSLTVSAEVSAVSIETREFGVVADEVDGLAWSLAAQQELANGALSGQIRRTINAATERTEVRVDRSMDLTRGSLSYGLGYSMSADGDDRFLARAAFSQDLPAGRLRGSLTQETISNDDDQDILLSRVSIGYDREINSVSGLGLEFGLGRSEDIGAGGTDDTLRANIDLTYRREVSRDWDWTLGYRARFLDESGGNSATSNEIFTTFGRSFTFRP